MSAAIEALRGSGINVFGAGAFARQVAAAVRGQGIPVHALLVSGDPAQPVCDGIPVRRASPADLRRAPTWIGVYNREAHSDYAALRERLYDMAAPMPLVWPQTYYPWIQEALGWRYWLHDPQDYSAAAGDIDAARGLLEDETSRDAFDRVLEFRRDEAANWQSPQPSGQTQYLPDWLLARIGGPLHIVDGGAYRGETLRELAAKADVAQAWTFEPDPQNFAALVRELGGFPAPVTNIPAGLGLQSATAAFPVGQGESGSFGAGPGPQVAIVALDECLHGAPVNFLKLDVEGHEIAALEGAAQTLRRERPVLAVAGYHRWDDLWRIPQLIEALQPGYRLRLSLHAHNSFDAVFYAY